MRACSNVMGLLADPEERSSGSPASLSSSSPSPSSQDLLQLFFWPTLKNSTAWCQAWTGTSANKLWAFHHLHIKNKRGTLTSEIEPLLSCTHLHRCFHIHSPLFPVQFPPKTLENVLLFFSSSISEQWSLLNFWQDTAKHHPPIFLSSLTTNSLFFRPR